MLRQVKLNDFKRNFMQIYCYAWCENNLEKIIDRDRSEGKGTCVIDLRVKTVYLRYSSELHK